MDMFKITIEHNGKKAEFHLFGEKAMDLLFTHEFYVGMVNNAKGAEAKMVSIKDMVLEQLGIEKRHEPIGTL